MHVVGPRGGTCGHHIYQIYASYLHVRILYEFLGTFQSLKVFGKFKNKSKCFWKPSSKFTIRNGYLVTVYKSGFEACLWSTSCASALVLALEIRRISSPCAVIVDPDEKLVPLVPQKIGNADACAWRRVWNDASTVALIDSTSWKKAFVSRPWKFVQTTGLLKELQNGL